MNNRKPKDSDQNGKETVAGVTDEKTVRVKDLGQQRRERIREHLAKTLESADTLQACMGPIACDLMEFCQDLKGAIDEAFATDRLPLERFENLRPAVELYVRVAHQAHRLAQLECHINESRQRDTDGANPPGRDGPEARGGDSRI